MPSAHDKYALDYDLEIERYDCRIAEVLFGLCFEDIHPGESLLDVGIGTGISSLLFHRAGLRISGIDGSKDMLSICASKGITDALAHQDILSLPWPYPDASFDHVISCGVFHFIGELATVFTEIQRVHKPGGLFAFTVMKCSDEQVAVQQHLVDDIPVFSHSAKTIQDLLDQHQYVKRKEIVSFVGETPYRVICAKKRGVGSDIQERGV